MCRDRQMSVSVCFCLCMFECCCSIKKSHCVTTARLVPSCFRGEGKIGRIRGGMFIGRGRASLELHTSIEGIVSKQCMLLWLSHADERLKSADIEEKKDTLRLQRMFVTIMGSLCQWNRLDLKTSVWAKCVICLILIQMTHSDQELLFILRSYKKWLLC